MNKKKESQFLKLKIFWKKFFCNAYFFEKFWYQIILFFLVLLKIEVLIFENQKFLEKNSEAIVGPYLKKGHGGRRGGG